MNLIPVVIEKSNFGERSYDIYSRLLKDRIVVLSGPVDDDLAASICAQLLFLAAQDSEKDISNIIDLITRNHIYHPTLKKNHKNEHIQKI